jgi:hypothetical protein
MWEEVAYVQVLVQGIPRVRSGGVRRGWKHILLTANDDDVRSVSSTCV